MSGDIIACSAPIGEDGAVHVRCSCATLRRPVPARRGAGETVYVVADNGIGVDARFQEKIFGLFEQLDPSLEGTGIGLTLVARIVEVHGGRIWVESEGKGRGSAFCFTLPGGSAEARPQNGDSPADSK